MIGAVCFGMSAVTVSAFVVSAAWLDKSLYPWHLVGRSAEGSGQGDASPTSQFRHLRGGFGRRRPPLVGIQDDRQKAVCAQHLLPTKFQASLNYRRCVSCKTNLDDKTKQTMTSVWYNGYDNSSHKMADLQVQFEFITDDVSQTVQKCVSLNGESGEGLEKYQIKALNRVPRHGARMVGRSRQVPTTFVHHDGLGQHRWRGPAPLQGVPRCGNDPYHQQCLVWYIQWATYTNTPSKARHRDLVELLTSVPNSLASWAAEGWLHSAPRAHVEANGGKTTIIRPGALVSRRSPARPTRGRSVGAKTRR